MKDLKTFKSISLFWRTALCIFGSVALSTGPAIAEMNQSLPPAADSSSPSNASPDSPEFWLRNKSGKIFFRIRQPSGEAERALAKHLSDIGAVMYATFWCPHCFEQLRLFGVEAIPMLNLVECDLKGIDPNPELCQQKFEEAEQQTGNGAGYPTWEFNGKFYIGRQSLEELARASRYQGTLDFQDPPPKATDQPTFQELFPAPQPPIKVFRDRTEESL